MRVPTQVRVAPNSCVKASRTASVPACTISTGHPNWATVVAATSLAASPPVTSWEAREVWGASIAPMRVCFTRKKREATTLAHRQKRDQLCLWVVGRPRQHSGYVRHKHHSPQPRLQHLAQFHKQHITRENRTALLNIEYTVSMQHGHEASERQTHCLLQSIMHNHTTFACSLAARQGTEADGWFTDAHQT